MNDLELTGKGLLSIDSSIKSINNKLNVENTGWKKLELINGFKEHSLYPTLYKIQNGILFLSGCVMNSDKTIKSKIIAKLPSNCIPNEQKTFTVAHMSADNYTAQVTVDKEGNVILLSVGTDRNVYLTQVSYPLF